MLRWLAHTDAVMGEEQLKSEIEISVLYLLSLINQPRMEETGFHWASLTAFSRNGEWDRPRQ